MVLVWAVALVVVLVDLIRWPWGPSRRASWTAAALSAEDFCCCKRCCCAGRPSSCPRHRLRLPDQSLPPPPLLRNVLPIDDPLCDRGDRKVPGHIRLTLQRLRPAGADRMGTRCASPRHRPPVGSPSRIFSSVRVMTRACCSSTSSLAPPSTPCSVSLRSMNCTNRPEDIAFSSTRSRRRNSILAVSRHAAGTSRRASPRCYLLTAIGRWFPLQPHRLDVREPQAKIDKARFVVEAIAPAALAQRAEDGEAGHVEVMRHEYALDAGLHQLVDQHPSSGTVRPLVDITAMSNRSAICACAISAAKPSFSMNRMSR